MPTCLLVAPLLAHAGIFAGGAGVFVYLIFWLVTLAADDGSRYLCPRCGAALRPYVKSCRFCRARFQVQPLTPGPRQQRADTRARARRPVPAKTVLPDPATLKACFRLPERELDERQVTREQKAELIRLGATSEVAVDALGCEQARYLIRFRLALLESERIQGLLPPGARSRLAWYVAVPTAAVVCLAVAVLAPPPRRQDHPEPVTAQRVDVAATSLPDPAPASPDAPVIPAGPAPQAAKVALVPTHPPGASEDASVAVSAATASRDVSFAAAVAASKARALRDHPGLGVAGSEMNAAFVARYKLLTARHSEELNAPDWPERLALQCEPLASTASR